MGMEYSLRFECASKEPVLNILRRLPFAQGTDSSPETFELRRGESSSEMPDATVKIEAQQVFCCVWGGVGRELLGILMCKLVDEFGAVTVSEFE